MSLADPQGWSVPVHGPHVPVCRWRRDRGFHLSRGVGFTEARAVGISATIRNLTLRVAICAACYARPLRADCVTR